MLDRLTIERIEAAANGGPILVAFSGGGDSTALLLLLIEHFGAARLRAAVVDHAMRAGSAEDAQRAFQFAESRGIRAELRTVSWGADQTRSQEAAREARHRALYDAARHGGALLIVLGHTADDQAETVMMRAAAGSTWRGLAGIAPLVPAPIWPEGRMLMLARPLLGVRRQSLRALLKARGVSWFDDPSNENAAYERVRARARISDLEQAGFDVTALTRLARRMRAIADDVDAAAAALIKRATDFEEDAITIEHSAWNAEAVVRERALSVLICAASGKARAPAPDAIARLETRMCETEFHGATLGGAVLSLRRGGIRITRDSGALSGRADGAEPMPRLALPVGEELVWDGRLALTASAPDVMVYAKGSTPRIEAPHHAIVGTHWLLAERVAHMLSAAPRGAAPQNAVNEINIPKP
ncbi:MAG: tRNA lysidine(34) synthetase TilS [Vitreimonas sp.]